MSDRRHMNVLLIMADQHQAACLGCEGHSQVITPNLDRLASEGMRFSQAYAQSPICTPARVSILSGQYPHNHGYFGLAGPAPRDLPSFLSHFRQNGYKTAGIGNLHTPNDPRNWLEEHVDLFADSFYSVDNQHENTRFYDKIKSLGLLEKEDFHFSERNAPYRLEGMPSQLPYEHSQEGWCVEEAIRFMSACGDEPFTVADVMATTMSSPRVAGMSRTTRLTRSCGPSRLPACGDEPCCADGGVADHWSSPRVRG